MTRALAVAATAAAVLVVVVGWSRAADDPESPPVTAATLAAATPTSAAPATAAPTSPLRGSDTTAPVPADASASPVERARTPTTAPVEVAEEVPMDQLLIDEITVGEVLPGMTLAADVLLGTGPLDLEAAANSEADPDAERSLLLTRRFEEGFSRGLVNEAGDTVLLQVYRFADADGAAAYLVDGAEQLLGRGAEPYEVDPLPGGLGFSSALDDFEAHGATFSVGRHHVLAVVGGAPGHRTAAEARLLALAQHDHLLGLTAE